MYRSLSLFAIAALLASAAVHAQSESSVRYKWHDAQGLSHFSDSLNAEAMKYGYDLVSDSGLVIRHVPRQLTADERATASKLAAVDAAKRRAAQAIVDAETQMMSAYPTEEMYRISLQQTLETIDQKIHTTQINLRSQEKALTDLLARAAEYEDSKKIMPPFMVNALAKQRAVVTEQRTTLHRQQSLHDQTVQLQVKQLARYRELKAAEAKGSE